MPSLAAGTNFTFNGRLVTFPGAAPNCLEQSVAVQFKVVVTSAGDLSTNYSEWDQASGSLISGLKQQAVVLLVSWTVAGVTTSKNFYGLFQKGPTTDNIGLGAFQSADGELVDLQIVTDDSVCQGKQAGRLQYTGPNAYSTIMGFVCRNPTVL